MKGPLRLPRPIQQRIDAAALELLQPGGIKPSDFAEPRGEPALMAPDSVSWQVTKNPLALFIGGVTAVLLELAEPRVRSGVWDYTSFRRQPLARMQRTALATLMTVYGPRSRAEALIASVVRLHEKIEGVTPSGRRYRASEPELLDWVHATASFGFVHAYDTYVRRLGHGGRDRYYVEGASSARLYGAQATLRTQADVDALFQAMRPKLERSPIVFEFLRIMRESPLLPGPLRTLQPLLVDAALAITPAWLRELLGIDPLPRHWGRRLVVQAARAADYVMLASCPPVLSCRRLGLPDDYLYTRLEGS